MTKIRTKNNDATQLLNTYQNTLNFTKREILRDLRKYSLESVIEACLTAIRDKKFLTPWIYYLIIKWKFIATDIQRGFSSGKECNEKILYQWCNSVWQSESNLEHLHHFLRNMFDTQMIWQKPYVLDVFFFPALISALEEEDPVRKHVLNQHGVSITEFKQISLLLYLFRGSPQTAIDAAQAAGPKIQALLHKIIEDLTTDWQTIAAIGVSPDPDEGFGKYLADIDLEEKTFEGTESPWMEAYPILSIGDKIIFSVDSQLWLRRISTYFYDKTSENLEGFSDKFGRSMEHYFETLLLQNFSATTIYKGLPSKSKNADFIAEDDNNFYIIEVKHKKYDSRIFNITDAKRLTLQLFNQVVKGYQQIKSTASNIDAHRIFKHKKKPLNKKRIGFVVTERSYGIGHGAHFCSLAGKEHKIHDAHIADNDIYFIGIQEFELLLLASNESSLSLASVAEACFNERQTFIDKRDLKKKFALTALSKAEIAQKESMSEFKRILVK